MEKLFYTDPLASAYMAREFGVKFEKVGYCVNSEDYLLMTGIEIKVPNWTDAHIHPDSYDIFKPQDCDVGIDSASRVYTRFAGKWIAQGRSSEPVYPVDIVTRGQQKSLKRFFSPEVCDG